MATITLDFLNKNMYRKYPFRATSTHLFTNGTPLPQSLITSIQITTIYTYRKVYVSKIYAKNNYVSVLIREVDTNIVLGSFSGVVTGNQQTLFLDNVVTEISGSLTIGDVAAISSINGVNYLTATTGRLEDSTIFCFTPPGVKSINHYSGKVTGFIELATNNIFLTKSSPVIGLEVVNTDLILSQNDFSGLIGNCPTPLVKKINSVPPDEDGNIDVFGIDPVKIEIATGKIILDTPDLTLPVICPEKNKLAPPYSEENGYYGDISTINTPEWKTWPQFSE